MNPGHATLRSQNVEVKCVLVTNLVSGDWWPRDDTV